MTLPRHAAPALTVVLAALLAAATVSASAATPPDVLVVAKNINDIVSLDPAQAYEFSSGEVVSNVYDRLVEYTAEDTQRLVGGLAESWTTSADGRTLTFKLRPGVVFTSGNPVRPADVVFSFARVVKLNKAPAFILSQLGWKPDTVESLVKAAGPDSVALTIPEPVSPAFVLNVLAARPAAIVDELTVRAHEVNGDLGNGWLNANSAGTGPFSLRAYKPNESVTLAANPAYFRGAPKLKAVTLRQVGDSGTERAMLAAGDIDIARDLTPDQIKAIEGDKSLRIGTYPQAAVHFLSLNQKTEALRNPKVWEAVHYLIDYDGMAASFLRGQMTVHQAFWPEGFPGALTDNPYKLDVPRAKALLAEAGLAGGFSITLDMISASPFTEMAQSLQATFAQANIKLELLPGTGAQVITRYRARSHQAMLLYWGPDFMDPHSNAKAFAYNVDNSDGAYQSTTTWRNAWAVPELSAETTAALLEPDPAKREALYLDLQRKVQASAPIILTFQAVNQVAMRDTVEGYVHGATADLVFYRLATKR